MVARGIDHRADEVEVRRQLLDPLTDVGVVLVERGVAEDVGPHEGASSADLAPRPLQERGDRGQPRLPGHRPGVLRRLKLAVGREAHVVELHLVEAAVDRFLRDGDVVGPHLLAEGVDPRQILAVDPRLACARIEDGEVRSRGGQDVVLERHDAGDRVDAARLEVGHHGVEVTQRRRPLRPRRQRLLDAGRIDDPAAIALDVDDDGVQLGAIDQVEDAAADAAVAEAEVGEVRGLDHLRPHDDLERALEDGRLHDDLGVARALDDQRAVHRRRQRERAILAEARLDAAGDDRNARQRLAVLVLHLAADRARPRAARALGRRRLRRGTHIRSGTGGFRPRVRHQARHFDRPTQLGAGRSRREGLGPRRPRGDRVRLERDVRRRLDGRRDWHARGRIDALGGDRADEAGRRLRDERQAEPVGGEQAVGAQNGDPKESHHIAAIEDSTACCGTGGCFEHSLLPTIAKRRTRAKKKFCVARFTL